MLAQLGSLIFLLLVTFVTLNSILLNSLDDCLINLEWRAITFLLVGHDRGPGIHRVRRCSTSLKDYVLICFCTPGILLQFPGSRLWCARILVFVFKNICWNKQTEAFTGEKEREIDEQLNSQELWERRKKTGNLEREREIELRERVISRKRGIYKWAAWVKERKTD